MISILFKGGDMWDAQLSLLPDSGCDVVGHFTFPLPVFQPSKQTQTNPFLHKLLLPDVSL